MSYHILLHPKANEFMKNAKKELSMRIKEKLRTLAVNPKAGLKLKYSDYWRLRIGEFRAIYEIDHANIKVIILFIGHRKDVYDDFSRLL